MKQDFDVRAGEAGPWTQVLQSVVPHELINRVLQGDPSNALHLLRFDPCHIDSLL